MKFILGLLSALLFPYSVLASPCDTFAVKLWPSDTLLCPRNLVEVRAEASGGLGAYSYTWGHENNSSDYSFFSAKKSQWVTVTVLSEGCPEPVVDSVFLRVKEVKADFSFRYDNKYTTGSNIVVQNNSTGSELIVIEVYKEEKLTEVYKRLHFDEYGFSFGSSGNYYLKFMIYDASGLEDSLFACSSKDTLHFTLKNDITVYLPNAFSPGKKDQLNDEFSLLHAGVTNLEFFVFDRRGQKVFYSNELDFSWNGRAENGRLLTGAYYYVLKAWNDEQEEVFSGILKII